MCTRLCSFWEKKKRKKRTKKQRIYSQMDIVFRSSTLFFAFSEFSPFFLFCDFVTFWFVWKVSVMKEHRLEKKKLWYWLWFLTTVEDSCMALSFHGLHAVFYSNNLTYFTIKTCLESCFLWTKSQCDTNHWSINIVFLLLWKLTSIFITLPLIFFKRCTDLQSFFFCLLSKASLS